MFPGPAAVALQDMMQCLHDRADSRSHDSADEPCLKRLKRKKAQDTPHTGSGTPEEANGLESRASPLQRVVFIDSTWNQTNKISTDERLKGNNGRLAFQRAHTAGDC